MFRLFLLLSMCLPWIAASQESEQGGSLEKYFGAYQLDSSRAIYIRTWDEAGPNQLTFFDNAGNVRALYAESEEAYVAGPAFVRKTPVQIRVRFLKDKNGRIDRLSWSEGKEPARIAKKLDLIHEENVTFLNGEISLAGTLVTPAAAGPHPCIVLVHGSGPVTRDFFGPIAYHFALHGIAVLAYDKRGIGGSAGNWLSMGFEDLAQDALAGVRYLKTRTDIDAHAIGLWAISQGGWIAPLAASQSADVAFLILVSASGVTPARQNLMNLEEESRVAGIQEEKIQQAIRERQAGIDSLRPEEVKTELQAEEKRLEEAGDKKTLASSSLENPRFLLFFRRIMDFDPLPVLQKIHCPVLAIYGELDRTVPVHGNREVLEQALERAVTVRLFPRANHALLEARTGSNDEFPDSTRFAPGFLDCMVDWILAKKNRGY